MGYRSDLVIGVKKTVLARDLLSNEIPPVFKKLPRFDTEDAVYWKIKDWKWYTSYPEIQEIEHWFVSVLDSEEFGAIRLGEDYEDVQTWGSPWNFEIGVYRHIDSPIDIE